MGATVGVDIGRVHLRSVLLDDDGAQLSDTKMRTPGGGDRGAVVEVLVASVHECVGRADLSWADIRAVGVGSPGAVLDGTVGQATNLPGWSERFGLAEVLERELSAPVRVVNDVTAAAVAEHRQGAGAGRDDLLVVWVGTGVGGGLILGGRAYEGAFGVAGELGHTVVEIGGAVCPCGRRGCVEAYSGRRAMEQAVRRAVDAGRPTSLFRIAEELGEDHLTSGVFRAALDEGDVLVADLVDDAAEALGKGIASAVNLLDVEAVIVGGGLAEELGARFVEQIEAEARPNLFLQPPRVEIVPAALGDLGGAIGAALLSRGSGPS